MTTDDRLLELCQRWRQLTEAEAKAIGVEDWSALAAAQKLKQAVRAEMDGAGRAVAPEQLRPFVAELMALERLNARALAERRQAAESEQARVEQAGRHLRQVHQAYAPQPSPVWHSYS